MPRSRALLAVLLAMTWCSAMLHEGLESVGLILDHAHHADLPGHEHHQAGTPDDDHDPVFARDIASDALVKANTGGVLWFALASLLLFTGLSIRPGLSDLKAIVVRRGHEPPLRRIWQFIWRCAPESAAPPTLA